VSLALPEIHEERLGNGAGVLVACRPGVPLVAARLLVTAGAALDPPGRSGLASLAATVARRGAGRRSGRTLDALVESLGADLACAGDEDATLFGLSAPVEVLPRLLGLLADVAMAPSFPAAEFERLRRRELAALANDVDEPPLLADRAMVLEAYQGHPYGHPVEGRLRDVARIRRRDAVAFHRRWYGPGHATLVIAGPVDAGRVLADARRLLSRWRSAPVALPAIPPPRASPRRVLVVDKPDATQTQIRLAGPAIPRNSPEYFPGVVANAVLGGGFTSRLVDAIRVNRGLSYGVRSRLATSRGAGLFTLSTFTKNETAGELVQVALDEIARYCDGGPTEVELERAASWLAGLYPMSLETHDQWAERLSDARLYGYSLEEVRDYRERVRAVTAGEAREFGRRHFPAATGVVVAVGPAREVVPQLERFGPLRVVSTRQVV